MNNLSLQDYIDILHIIYCKYEEDKSNELLDLVYKLRETIQNIKENEYVYEIVKQLKSTTINQGKLTMDPMVSPMVEKTERYYFTVKEEKIIKVKLEEEYER